MKKNSGIPTLLRVGWFKNAKQFELMVDITLIVLVLIFSTIFNRMKSTEP
ncbi:hypothetical protein [Methanobrevibacter thaueri]|nr:hypothetical protein [Methanobrevibacter thaueri]